MAVLFINFAMLTPVDNFILKAGNALINFESYNLGIKHCQIKQENGNVI